MNMEALWHAYQADRSIANRNAILEAYLPWLTNLCNLFHKHYPWIQTDEAFSLAAEATIGCIERHDPAQAKFTTWAQRRIWGHMLDQSRPYNGKTRYQLKWERRTGKHAPINTPIEWGSLQAKAEAQLDGDDAFDWMMSWLNPINGAAITMHYRDGLTGKEIGKKLAITKDAVFLRIRTGIHHLRTLNDKILQEAVA
jgi:RNA polymerase sigma factor (sigma-70 family)